MKLMVMAVANPQPMETLLGSALEDELVIDATIANSDILQRDALWDVRDLL